MNFIIGFLIWAAMGLVGALLVRAVYRAAGTAAALSLVFGVLGAFIGGMLGVSAYIYHDPTPLRFGGMLGAALGALFFPFIYQFIARKAV